MKPCLVPVFTAFLAFASCSTPKAQGTKDGIYLPTATGQTETDEYTRYELLAPGSGKFKITYEVTATAAGAKHYYNPIRKGSAATEESVLDAMTGKQLQFEIVSGAEARKDPLMADADLDTHYIKVALARPVPTNGQGRIVIIKTYEDAKSYFVDGKAIVFDRPLGVRRNKVVLPPGYEVVGLTVPSQLLTESDGRIAISFLNNSGAAAPVVLRATKTAQTGAAATPKAATKNRSWESPFEGETEENRLSERAHQDRDIVYFLQQPETHCVRSLSRLHRDPSGRERLRERGSQRQHCQQSVGEHSRYGRAAAGEGDERRRDGCDEDQRRRSSRSRCARRRDSVPCGAGRPDDSLADRRNLHRTRELQARRRRPGVRSQSRSTTQCRGAAVRLVLHVQRDSRDCDSTA